MRLAKTIEKKMKSRPISTFGDPSLYKCLPHLMDEMNKLDNKRFGKLQKILQKTNIDVLFCYSMVRYTTTKQKSTLFTVCDLLKKKHCDRLDEIKTEYPEILISLAKNFVTSKFNTVKKLMNYEFMVNKSKS